MITTQEQKVIDQYVDEAFYNKEKLIKYLNMHDFWVIKCFRTL